MLKIDKNIEKIITDNKWTVEESDSGEIILCGYTPLSCYQIIVNTDWYNKAKGADFINAVIGSLSTFDASEFAYDAITKDDSMPTLDEMQDILNNARQAKSMCENLMYKLDKGVSK